MKGIVHYGLRYERDGEMMMHGFIDSDWAGDKDNRKRKKSKHSTIWTFSRIAGIAIFIVEIAFFIAKMDSVPSKTPNAPGLCNLNN